MRFISEVPKNVKSTAGNGAKAKLFNSTAAPPVIIEDLPPEDIIVEPVGTAAVPSRKRRRRRPRRHFQNGCRRAAVRAHLAARLCVMGFFKSVTTAAEACGSNPRYVEALIILLQAENTSLLNSVLAGEMSILGAAAQMKRLAKLVTAFRSASASDRVAFAKTIGPTSLFDHTLVPAL